MEEYSTYSELERSIEIKSKNRVNIPKEDQSR
jgi:hypothetical protein